jgi:hypothetical protein
VLTLRLYIIYFDFRDYVIKVISSSSLFALQPWMGLGLLVKVQQHDCVIAMFATAFMDV